MNTTDTKGNVIINFGNDNNITNASTSDDLYYLQMQVEAQSNFIAKLKNDIRIKDFIIEALQNGS